MARRRLSEPHRVDTDPMLMEEYDTNNSVSKKLKQDNGKFIKILAAVCLFVLGIYLFSRKANLEPKEQGLTNACSSAYPGKPLKQYVLMIDAGSSGSRIHVYRFNFCKKNPEIEDEVFEQLKPGLSDYISDPEEAAKSLDKLLKVALKSVPKELHECTPIAVKATAGLRIYKKKSDAVLGAVRHRIKHHFPFPIIDKNGVEIMSGKDEGVYAWITVNYLLEKLNSDAKEGSSVATIDLGGGSVQLVFEPKFQLPYKLEDGEHKFELDFSGRHHVLYQQSYLGYGLNEARSRSHQLLIEANTKNDNEIDSYDHPCFKKGHEIQYLKDGKEYKAIGVATSFDECHTLAKRLFEKEKECRLNPCSFNGIYQPSLKDTFGDNDIYAFSFFYDRTQPFGLNEKFTVKEIKELAKRICNNDKEYFEGNQVALDQLESKPYRCFDVTYLYTLLNTGFDIEDGRLIRTAKKIKNLETGWCLGASIAVLDDKNYCPSK
ncbi:nucleoside phosphatase GDA1/CD39 [Neoconidiobolus thromboides FSU 785]|nr:nucleoside phosphatase GDA1/CD39 [Neoconidiobolus thromboides FSU 785]